MRTTYRILRRGLALLFFLMAVSALGYYLLTTLTGIAREVEQQRELRHRTELMVETTTAIAPTIAAESMALARFDTLPGADAPAVEEALLPDTGGAEAGPPTLPATDADPTTATEVAALVTLPPSETPSPGITPSSTSSATTRPSATATEAPATATSTASNTPEPSETATEVAQLPTAFPTNTARATVFPTNTPRPSATVLPSETPTPTLTLSPTESLPPTETATPSMTPTASNTPLPTTTPYPIEGTYATPVVTPIMPLPPRAPLMENDDDIVNVVLLGSDTRGNNIGRTDVIIVVSINKTANTVAMWHIPRDVLVYIPGYTIDRINLAYPKGYEMNYPGLGPGLMKETIEYNFGLHIDYYARVNFEDFEQIIERLGGLVISVDCQLTDWALIDAELDPSLEENWEQFTLGIGRQTLTPYYALWYARSRVSTSDLDRGRRQLDVLRAIWQQARQQGLLTQVTDLYPDIISIVDTDMGLEDMVGLLVVGADLELQNIERYNGLIGTHYDNYTTPDDGRSVLIPNWEAIYQLAQNFVTPPTANRLERDAVTVEIVDSTAWGIGFDQVVADRLAWDGFAVNPVGYDNGSIREITQVVDYTGDAKGSALERIQTLVRVGDSQITFEPDPNRSVDYRIYVGRDYSGCVRGSSADNISDAPPIESETDANGEPAGTPSPEPTVERLG